MKHYTSTKMNVITSAACIRCQFESPLYGLRSWSLNFPFFFFGHTMRHVGSWFPDQGSNPHPVQWKCGVLTTGPRGKSLEFSYLFFFFPLEILKAFLLKWDGIERADFDSTSGWPQKFPCLGMHPWSSTVCSPSKGCQLPYWKSLSILYSFTLLYFSSSYLPPPL